MTEWFGVWGREDLNDASLGQCLRQEFLIGLAGGDLMVQVGYNCYFIAFYPAAFLCGVQSLSSVFYQDWYSGGQRIC